MVGDGDISPDRSRPTQSPGPRPSPGPSHPCAVARAPSSKRLRAPDRSISSLAIRRTLRTETPSRAATASSVFDDRALAALVLMIAVTNLFNRLNATTRRIAGAWG